MNAKATYRYEKNGKFEEYTCISHLAFCWDSIHKYGNYTKIGYDGTLPILFKNHLIRQYYEIPVNKYNQYKELIDKYLKLLKSFNSGITWKVFKTNLIIDINVKKLRSVKERKINSFLIRYIFCLTENYNSNNRNKIVETIVGLKENGATIMDSLLVGSLIGYNNFNSSINLLNTYYTHNDQSYLELIPKRITKKEYIDNIKTMEDNNNDTYFHKHTFKYIPNTTDKAYILKQYLINKNYKQAIKYFKNEQKQN
jgi:hypothetical protein